MANTNCLLAAPDFVQADPAFATVAFSGGSWLPALPISNLRDPQFAMLARSTNLSLSSTQCWIDLGVSRGVRIAAVPISNGTVNCKMRLRGCVAQDTATALADTGWKLLYPPIYPSLSLQWGHPSLWDGKMQAEAAAAVAVIGMPWLAIFPIASVCRYWLLEIDDTTNAAGYFQLPRVILAPGWQPSLNLTYGASLMSEDPTQVQTSLGSAEYFDVRAKRRVVHFSLAYLPEDEALSMAFDIQQLLGVGGQLFFVWNPADTMHLHRRSFLARMRTLSPLEAAVFGRVSQQYELVEVVA